MAREIDLTKPLSDEDRQYLVDRCRWSQLAQADELASAQEAQRAASEEHTPSTPSPQPPTTVVGGAPVEPTQGATSDEQDPYEEWTYEELKAELDVRKQEALNEGMPTDEAGKLFSKGGSQKDLVARLYADDERVSGQ